MKITLLISSLSGGGAERVVSNLANYLVCHMHTVDILTVSDLHTYHIDSGVNHICMYNESKSKLPKLIINIFRLYNFNKYLRNNHPDIYVSFLPDLTVLLMKQRYCIKAPVVIAERADPNIYCNESRKNRSYFNKYFKKGHGYVFQTDDAKNYYANHGIDVSNSIVIPNAINTDFIKDEYNGKREKIIVSLGRLNNQKNFPLLIKAFAQISEYIPEYKLVLYGEGNEYEHLQALIEVLKMNEKIILSGYINNVVEALQKASLFVLSSDYEGMPNALAEAMALGVPCISTDCPVGGPRFLIRNGQNGILVPVREETTLAKAMKTMLFNYDKALEMARKARTIASELTPEKTYGAWEQFFCDTIRKFKSK